MVNLRYLPPKISVLAGYTIHSKRLQYQSNQIWPTNRWIATAQHSTLVTKRWFFVDLSLGGFRVSLGSRVPRSRIQAVTWIRATSWKRSADSCYYGNGCSPQRWTGHPFQPPRPTWELLPLPLRTKASHMMALQWIKIWVWHYTHMHIYIYTYYILININIYIYYIILCLRAVFSGSLGKLWGRWGCSIFEGTCVLLIPTTNGTRWLSKTAETHHQHPSNNTKCQSRVPEPWRIRTVKSPECSCM